MTTQSTRDMDLALGVLLRHTLDDRHVATIDLDQAALEFVASLASDVTSVNASSASELDENNSWEQSDVLIVSKAEAFNDTSWVEVIKRRAPKMLLVVSAEAASQGGAADALRGALEHTYGAFRVVGDAPVTSRAFAELSASPRSAAVDGTLLGSSPPEFSRYVFFAGDTLPHLDDLLFVQTPPSPQEIPEFPLARPPSIAPEFESEFSRLEAKLRQTAEDNRRLTARAEKSDVIIRDLTQELREWADGKRQRRAGRSDAAKVKSSEETNTSRDLDTVASLAAAEFTIDELRTRLEAKSKQGAEQLAIIEGLQGEASGLRFRVDELGRALETHQPGQGVQSEGTGQAEKATQEHAEALLDAKQQVDNLESKIAGLEAQIADLEDTLALLRGDHAELTRELRRVNSRENAVEGALSRADELQTEVEELRRINAELTLASVEFVATKDALEQRGREATSALAARDALVTRLQLDLAQQENASASEAARAARLQSEVASLKDAVIEASTRVDECDRLTKAVEAAQAREKNLEQHLEEAKERATMAESQLAEAERSAALTAEQTVDTSELEALREERDSATSQLEIFAGELKSVRETLATTEEKLATTEEKLRLTQQRRQEGDERMLELQRKLSEKAEELSASRKRAASASKEIEERLTARIEALEADLQRHRQRTTELETADSERSAGIGALEANLEKERAFRATATAALRAAREQLISLRDQSGSYLAAGASITAVGTPAPSDAGMSDSMVAMLTAQLEERNDRIRAYEKQLEGADSSITDRLELEERVARLTESLAHEEAARRSADERVVSLLNNGSDDELQESLTEAQTELKEASARSASLEEDVSSLKDVCKTAREGLESLLSDADADEEAARRIGALLDVLRGF